jgi:hypothetical protein
MKLKLGSIRLLFFFFPESIILSLMSHEMQFVLKNEEEEEDSFRLYQSSEIRNKRKPEKLNCFSEKTMENLKQ